MLTLWEGDGELRRICSQVMSPSSRPPPANRSSLISHTVTVAVPSNPPQLPGSIHSWGEAAEAQAGVGDPRWGLANPVLLFLDPPWAHIQVSPGQSWGEPTRGGKRGDSLQQQLCFPQPPDSSCFFISSLFPDKPLQERSSRKQLEQVPLAGGIWQAGFQIQPPNHSSSHLNEGERETR